MALAETGPDLRAAAMAMFATRRLVTLGVPLAVLAYFAYIFVSFDITGIAGRARPDNARTLVADSYSYKTHFTRDNRSGTFSIAIEGENKGTYPDGMLPEWVTLQGDDADIALEGGGSVRFRGDGVEMTVPDFGEIRLRSGADGIEMELPTDTVPSWINASSTRVSITTPNGRLQVTRSKSEVFR